jgi:transcriptional regulator with XRE-family HTH domain
MDYQNAGGADGPSSAGRNIMNMHVGTIKISVADFDRCYEEIKSADYQAPNDQAVAQLFADSGWTQKEIADHLGLSQPYVSQLLIFGRFIKFTAAAIKLMTLAEWKFRKAWEKTTSQPTEVKRFQMVERLLDWPITSDHQSESDEDVDEPKGSVLDDEEAFIQTLLSKRGMANTKNYVGYARAVFKYGEPNIRKVALNKKVGLQALACYCREITRDEQRCDKDNFKTIQRKGNAILHDEDYTETPAKKAKAKAKAKAKSKANDTNMTREERAEVRAEVRKQLRQEELEKQRQFLANDTRPKLRESTHIVYMYGVKIWPVTEQEQLVVGHYDYDQMFFTVHQFWDMHKMISVGVKDVASQAKMLREIFKSWDIFIRRRLVTPCQKEMTGCIRLFQKLADFLADNPKGKCFLPEDRDGALNGWS